MKHLKKYNEDMESDELGFKLVNMEPDELDGEIEIGQSWDRLPDGSELKEGYDEEGWPHYKLSEELPVLKPGQQQFLVKQAIIEYYQDFIKE